MKHLSLKQIIDLIDRVDSRREKTMEISWKLWRTIENFFVIRQQVVVKWSKGVWKVFVLLEKFESWRLVKWFE